MELGNQNICIPQGAILCGDARMYRLMEIELSLCGVAQVTEAADADLWLLDLDDDTHRPTDAPEDCRILCWSRRGAENFSDLDLTSDRICFLKRPFVLEELEQSIRRLVSYSSDIFGVPREVEGSPAFVRREVREIFQSKAKELISPVEEGVILVDGAPVALTPREWALFTCLWDHRGQLVPKATLLEALCAVTDGGTVATNILEVYVCHLREKLEKPLARRMITTVRGKGYRMEL